ncbi:hypothetical protein [Devosia sp. Root635]|uniref:hypothetical protein n=1 Tax=Devosia sp. Root635 TaxID=1736575 RepID=UPI0006F81BB0|nr:hypothetical protein [Devosia sp. Root635]KRA42058.1 hypothetical protein ASD80_10045 [Devosia sp. Root635]
MSALDRVLAEAELELNVAAADALIAYAQRLEASGDPETVTKVDVYAHTLKGWRDAAMNRIAHAAAGRVLH